LSDFVRSQVFFLQKTLDIKISFKYVNYMATLNLIKAAYVGKLGKTTGTTYKGRAVVKSAIEGKKPATVAQLNNVRAFEKLNRLSAAMARYFWGSAPINDKAMSRMNAYAHYLKALIVDHVFRPADFVNVIAENDTLSIQSAIQQIPVGSITVMFNSSELAAIPAGSVLHIIAVDENGYCGLGRDFTPGLGPFIVSPPAQVGAKIWVLAFLSNKFKSKTITFCGSAMEVTGMQYSLDEQLTGDLWVDGSPIYQKTFNFPNLPGNSTFTYELDELDANALLFMEGFAVHSGGFGGGLVTFLSSNSSYWSCMATLAPPTFKLYTAMGSGTFNLWVTFKYTKAPATKSKSKAKKSSANTTL
jgi:hypothetical protein